jgi:hypothetical protein
VRHRSSINLFGQALEELYVQEDRERGSAARRKPAHTSHGGYEGRGFCGSEHRCGG